MNTKSIRPWALVLLALAASPLALAQDPAVVAPDFYKCTFENEHARLCEVSFKPGATIPAHSHPQHLIYAVTPGKLRIFAVGAEPADVELTAGQVLWIPSQTHHGTNTGSSDLRLLVVEFKALAGPDAAIEADKQADKEAKEAAKGDAGKD
jgi:quercetin dioxygenase-like cupin family protein